MDCVINSGAYSPTQTDFLNHVFQGGVAGRMNNPQAKDLSDCAAYLIYRVSTGTYPASTVSALMIDVAAKATSELAANNWVNGLAESARKARESGAEAPKPYKTARWSSGRPDEQRVGEEGVGNL